MSDPRADLADALVFNEVLAILIRRYSARLLTAGQLAQIQNGVALCIAGYKPGDLAYKPTDTPPVSPPIARLPLVEQ